MGAHTGHSTLAALDPRFGFDTVFCFEPVPALAQSLGRIRDARVVVVEAALSDRDGIATLYQGGTLAGSLFSDGPILDEAAATRSVRCVRASTFLADVVPHGAFVRAKFNCEGAELLIIDDLLQHADRALAGAVLTNALIDFDIAKIPSQAHRQRDVESQLRSRAIDYLTPSMCQDGSVTNYGAVRNYLFHSGAALPGLVTRIRSAAYNVAMARDAELNGYHKMRLLRAVPALRHFARSHRLSA